MRIWFDLSNSPHVNMFCMLIRELENEGYTIIITTRPLANTIELLDQKELTYSVIGSHYGKNFIKKILGYPVRVLQLYSFLKKQKPDLAVSQSSFHSPVVAKLLGIPSVYTNDNEHAMGNYPAFLCATKILIPENLDPAKVAGIGIPMKKIIQYPGVKEGIFLWPLAKRIHSERNNKPDSAIQIYIRPEPQTAQYYHGKENFLDELILSLQHHYKIIVLARDARQQQHYLQPQFSAVTVPEKPLAFEQVAVNCTLFIGAGGSMTREFAILGIPVISVYQDELLDVDRYLIKEGLMLHDAALTAQKLKDHIHSVKHRAPSLALMDKGKHAYLLFKSMITTLSEGLSASLQPENLYRA